MRKLTLLQLAALYDQNPVSEVDVRDLAADHPALNAYLLAMAEALGESADTEIGQHILFAIEAEADLDHNLFD